VPLEPLEDWLKTHHEGVTAGAPILANLLTIVALVVTLMVSSRQLRLAQASLQNNLIYTMQKDERTIAADYFGGKTDDTSAIFGQMQAVFLQRCLGSIPDDVWPVFQKDFSGIMSEQRLQRDWETISKNISSKKFVSYVDDTIKKQGSPDCGGGKP